MPTAREDLANVGKRIRQIRLLHKLTQEEFGQIIGKSTATVYGYESGKILPPSNVILTISSLFHVSVKEIFGLKSNEQDENTIMFYYEAFLKESGE